MSMGVDLAIYAYGTNLASGSKTCPLSMLKRYIQLAHSEGADKFLFRPLVFCKSSNQHKLRNGQMTYSRCREIFKEALNSIGVEAKDFGLHSLRAGGRYSSSTIGGTRQVI